MAIVKIPTERERERRHDEDVCNLFLTRVEFHHGPTATTIFVPPHGNNYFSATQPPRIRIRRWIPVQFLEIVVVGLSLRNCPLFPLCIHRRILACCWERRGGARNVIREGSSRGTAKNGCIMSPHQRRIVGFDRSSGNDNSGTRTGRFECGWIANGASIVCIVRLGYTGHVRGPRLHRRDDASPDGSRGGSIQFANKYRGDGGKDGRARVLVWDFFFPLFERTADDDRERAIRGWIECILDVNRANLAFDSWHKWMERGVRILYRHLRSMVFFVFLFSFLMNFTEGGRRIIRHGSAGKVSGECWRLLIISCSCLQTPFFLRGWKRSRRAFRVSRDESISRQRPGISGSGPKGMRTTDRFYGVSRAIEDIPLRVECCSIRR